MTKQLFLSTTVNVVNVASVNLPFLLINRSPTNHNGEKSLNSMSYPTLVFVLVLRKANDNFHLLSGVVMSGVVTSGVVMSSGCNVRGCNVLGL